MTPDMTIMFDVSGVGHCLYGEMINLETIGKLRIERATNIEYDNRRGVWRVYDLTGFAMFTAPTRQQCLDWEGKYLGNKKGGVR